MNNINNYDLQQAQQILGYNFTDLRLLEQAFTHRSFLNEASRRKETPAHNERLEFLGDAVLELIVTDYLYRKYPAFPEGKLTAIRASLVNYKILGRISKELGLENFLKLSKGELIENNERSRLPILADCFEAILGAIYLDTGLLSCKNFVELRLLPYTEEIVLSESYRDSKSQLQEFFQSTKKITPHYKILLEEGKEHDKIFTVGLFVGLEQLCTGVGRSKQEAELNAAANALLKIKLN